MAARFESVDDYIASYPPDVQVVLAGVRDAIHSVAPEADEKISYAIPTVTLDGRALVYFAAWKSHIGIYPIPPLEPGLETQVAGYRAAKDTLRLPLGGPIPYDLVRLVVSALVERRRA